jgi:hypothetical protein
VPLGVSLVVEALGVGAYGNSITVQVTHPDGTHYTLIIVGTDGAGNTVYGSVAVLHDYRRGGGVGRQLGAREDHAGRLDADPGGAASALGNTTSGADDRASITDTQWATARALFPPTSGRGRTWTWIAPLRRATPR